MTEPPVAAPTLFEQATLLLRSAGIMPVVTVDKAAHGAAIAAALAEGGLGAIEITLRSPSALAAISAAKRDVPGMLVGAGTILDARQAQAALAAGADFIVTPGTPPALAETLAGLPVPCIPGAATVSEMLALAALGFESLKLFPAMPIGGIGFLAAIAAPLPQLRFCPTGGIDEAGAGAFLALPNVVCVGGSWMVTRESASAGRYDAITEAALRARAIVDAANASRGR